MGTVLREGYCEFCNEMLMVEVPIAVSQEYVDKEVTWKCNCKAAKGVREKNSREMSVRDT